MQWLSEAKKTADLLLGKAVGNLKDLKIQLEILGKQVDTKEELILTKKALDAVQEILKRRLSGFKESSSSDKVLDGIKKVFKIDT